jgi:hypothetical protein
MSVTVSANIFAGAIAHKWSGAIVSCKQEGDKTVVTFEAGSPVAEKTVEEILEAQSEYVVYKAVMDEIERLETVPRRIRENLIALGTEDQVVIDEDAAIAVEREKL